MLFPTYSFSGIRGGRERRAKPQVAVRMNQWWGGGRGKSNDVFARFARSRRSFFLRLCCRATKAGRSTRANYLHNRWLEKYENTRVFSFRDVRTSSKIAQRSAFSRPTRAETTLPALCKWSGARRRTHRQRANYSPVPRILGNNIAGY